MRSKRRRKNKQVMRAKLKPKYDAHLAAIVKTFQEETDEKMETASDIDLSNVKVVDPDKIVDDMDTDNKNKTELEEKVKIPRVHIKKLAKFMSQKKYRTYQAKEKAKKKKTSKVGQKKQKQFKW